MKNEPDFVELGKFFEVNPSRVISRGDITPFIPMDALIENSRQVSQISYREYTGSGVKFINGDTLIARITPCLENGKTVFISNLDDDVIGHGSTEFIVLSGKAEISDNLYAYYLARSPDFRSYAISHMEGTSGRQRVPTSVIEKYLIKLPPLPEQRAIAAFLGALDDKIELNRRMNRTLEEIAQAIYIEMIRYVDTQCSILEFADLLSGGTPSTAVDEYWNGDIEWISAKDVSIARGIFILDTEKKISRKGLENSAARILPEKTSIVTARGTVGAHCMISKPMAMNQTNYGLKGKNGIGDYFIFLTLSNMIEELHQQSYGTIFDTITTKTFQSVFCPQPSLEKINEFENQVKPIMDAILNNEIESRTLASIRDILLPKIISGRISIKV